MTEQTENILTVIADIEIGNREQIIKKLNRISFKCSKHARTCHECYMPIMDEEGNPGYMGEACVIGARLLGQFHKLEAEYFKAGNNF